MAKCRTGKSGKTGIVVYSGQLYPWNLRDQLKSSGKSPPGNLQKSYPNDRTLGLGDRGDLEDLSKDTREFLRD